MSLMILNWLQNEMMNSIEFSYSVSLNKGHAYFCLGQDCRATPIKKIGYAC